MIFRNHQKIFATIGIMAITIPALFLVIPRKANATVPVQDEQAEQSLSNIERDASTIKDNTGYIKDNTGDKTSTVLKEMRAIRKKEVSLTSSESKGISWDSIAYTAAGVVLNAVTDSIVKWINNGFQGQPGFITDPEAFFTDAVDQATGKFFKEFLSPEVYNAICTPFRSPLILALKTTNSFQQRMTCTLSSVMKNATDLSQGIREGDWNNWITVTSNPQNNPYGALTVSLEELRLRQTTAVNNAQTESIFNQGFLSQKKCVEYYDNQWTGELKCVKYTATSPGKWVSDTLGQATGIDMQRLAVADEIDEILSALISQFLKGILK